MGPKEGEVTPFFDDGLLASTDGQATKTINISTAARNQDGGTLLPRGTVLVLMTAGADEGLYMEFEDSAANGQGDSATAVILYAPVDVDEVNAGQDHRISAGYYKGTFKREKLEVGAGFDESACQRLIIWPLA